MSGHLSLAQQLAQARADRVVMETPSCCLADAHAAYAVQHEILRSRGDSITGWKVGAKSPGGPIQCAPLPSPDMRPDGARLSRRDFVPLGLELEIAFRFERAFEPNEAVYSDDEVMGSIGSMAATIEIVSSRYAAWPDIDKLLQLADLQNHGALIVGEFSRYDERFPFTTPGLQFTFDHADITRGTPGNPAGDPRSLLPWLVNHITGRGITIMPEMIMTTGSYTGMFFPQAAGTATGTIHGLPPVSLVLT